MKRLLIGFINLLVLVFMASPALSIQYCKDYLEPGNPGGWGTSSKTFDDEITSAVTEEFEIDIWLNDCPENMIASGFFITFDPELVSIVSVDAYDNYDLPGPWDAGWTTKHMPEPGTYFFVVTNTGVLFLIWVEISF